MGTAAAAWTAQKKITRRYSGRGSVHYSSGFRYQVGRLSKMKRGGKQKKGGGGDGVFKRFLRSQKKFNYTPAMRSKI